MRTIVMHTDRHNVGVYYDVVVAGNIVWDCFVKFGSQKCRRAGGHNFVQAARKQEQVAMEQIAAMKRELTKEKS